MAEPDGDELGFYTHSTGDAPTSEITNEDAQHIAEMPGAELVVNADTNEAHVEVNTVVLPDDDK